MTLKGALAFTVVSLLMPCLLLCQPAGCTTHPPTASEPTNGIGRVVFAIFTIEDGTLTLAVDDMSQQPPKTFSGATSRYSLKKVQPQ